MGECTQIISDTVQLGGVLVFIEDHAPENFKNWLDVLLTRSENKIPFVVRSLSSLQSGKYKTRSEDLVLLFESQIDCLNSVSEGGSGETLNQVLQGQRLLLGYAVNTYGIDYICDDVVLDRWADALDEVISHLNLAKPMRETLRTQESPCLFLDRDDVVVRNVPYNRDSTKVELLPGVVDLIQRAHYNGYWVALVTNQSGIGRGRISWLEYKSVHQRMLELLAENKCWIDECVWASFIENEAVIEGRLLAGLRKPRAGMFQIVHDKLRTKMSESYMVGDSATDLMAAHAAGVKNLYLLSSDKIATEELVLKSFQLTHPEMHFKTLNSLKDLCIGEI